MSLGPFKIHFNYASSQFVQFKINKQGNIYFVTHIVVVIDDDVVNFYMQI